MEVNAFTPKPNLNHFINGKMYFCTVFTFSPFTDYLNEIKRLEPAGHQVLKVAETAEAY